MTAQAVAAADPVLAHSLNLKVVAEGVEQTGQMDYLRDQKCDMAQGYLYGRPVPADEFIALLERHPCQTTTITPSQTDTLLIVDDEANILSALGRLFRRDGYRLLRAESGREALALLAASKWA